MHRRALLTAAAGLLPAPLAGCTGEHHHESSSGLGVEDLTSSLEMTTVADADLPRKVLYSVGTEDGPTRRRARLLDRILDGGETVEGTRPPLPAARHLWYDGTVYRLSYEVTERTPATRYSVKVDIVEGPVDESESIRFSELPRADREVFAENALADGDTVGVGTTLLYTDAERDRSALVPESNYSVITWENGSRAKWVVDDAYETTIRTYRYVAAAVAPASEYGRRMRERFAFELSELSDAEREIVETAVEEDRYAVAADGSPSDALAALADRFRSREQVHALDAEGEGDLSGSYLARYDGEVYWTTFLAYGNAFGTETSN